MSDGTNEPTIDLDQARSALRTPKSDPIASSPVGQVLRDRYVLQARLGTGSKGAVFKALDRFRTTLPDTQQYVALKILHAGGDCSEQTLANLRLEFHCGQVLSHRNIVNVYELDRAGDAVFFTMELLDGEPLSNVIKRLSPAAMRKSHAWQLIRQLGAGLAHAHERGVVHGDLNPRNIFITREGELRILDFGAAHRFMAVKSQSEHNTDYAPTSGTSPYVLAAAPKPLRLVGLEVGVVGRGRGVGHGIVSHVRAVGRAEGLRMDLAVQGARDGFSHIALSAGRTVARLPR